MNKVRLGIFGATGKVGGELLRLLEQDTNFPIEGLPKLFGSARSAGKLISFKGEQIAVLNSIPENIVELDLIISCANGEVSETLVPEALKRGVKLVVDSDSFYRMSPTVPLVTVGVNDEDIDWHQGIIAGPNCSTAQLVVPLKALHSIFGLKRVVVNTYQSVSGAGKAAIDSLFEQCREITTKFTPETLDLKQLKENDFAFNVIPQISKMQDSGYTKEEIKVITETRKMLHVPDLAITCTAVRVPVFVGHSESVNVQLYNNFNLPDVYEVLKSCPYIQLWENFDFFPTPVTAALTEPVHVSRVREDKSADNALDMWVVADNLLIGAALNALRIASEAIKRGKV
jgi:aspartate-semialdehyde dehydrogenase